MPPDGALHQITAGLQEAYSNTTLVSKRSVEREPKTISSAQDPLGDVLTDRQREVLELAYHAGFFASPRLSTGDEIADSMDISSPTFYLHVRKATQNLLEEVFVVTGPGIVLRRQLRGLVSVQGPGRHLRPGHRTRSDGRHFVTYGQGWMRLGIEEIGRAHV